MRLVTVRLLAALLTAALPFIPPISSSFAHGPASQGGQAPAVPPGRAKAEQLTLQLANLNAQYHLGGARQHASLEAQMLSVAISREQTVAALLEADPGEFLRVALPSGRRSSLPASVQAHTEEDTDVDGTLEVLHEDDTSGGRYRYHLDTTLGRLELRFAAESPDHLMTGARIRAHGTRLQNLLALSSGRTSVQTLASALPNAFGAQKTLVILVNFTDNATQPYTVADARSVVFTTTSNFDLENSYGQTWLTGDVVGWYTIPMNSTVCDYTTLATYAKQAAASAGVSVSSYNRLVYAFPGNACSWWGLGSVGGNPSQAWINGSFQLRVVGHEMGHNFGLYHSHSYDCGTAVLGTGCTISEYGDTFDIMGGASYHFNAFQKERLGWLNYGSSPGITTVTASGTYTIDPYETAGGVKALKIMQDATSQTYYYFEYRGPLGFDAAVSGNVNMANGVVVHLGTPSSGNSSYLLDMTPDTTSWSDPALVTGQSYVDTKAGVSFAPLWVNSTNAAVNVSFGAQQCVKNAPTIAISPSQSQWVQAGSTVTYTVTVTNNDNNACTVSTFNLQAAVPSGWTAAVGTPTATVAPGASASAAGNVTSPPSATEGYYPVGVTATDVADATRSVTTSATYVIQSGLDVGVTTDRAAYTANQTAVITTSVRANGAPVSGASVTVTITRANGSTASLTATTGSDGSAMVKYRLKRQDPKGAYGATSNVTQNGAINGTASTIFMVQ